MEVWIGLVGVCAYPGSATLTDKKGAYVNALAWVSSAIEFENAVQHALKSLDLFAFEFDDVEPFEKRTESWLLEPELRELAVQVRVDKETRFGTFCTYGSTDG